MSGNRFMLIAGEASGDTLAAELVGALKTSPRIQARPWPPVFFGAGGPQMASAGVELAIHLTEHAVFGISDALANYWKFRSFFQRLFCLALAREPEVIILVDYAGFNLRFAEAIQRYVRTRSRVFHNWNPKIVQYVSPQVWASREGRAYRMARVVDLLLSIFPFEKAWYAGRVPNLRVKFIGHPLLDRHSWSGDKGRKTEDGGQQAEIARPQFSSGSAGGNFDIAPSLSSSPVLPLLLLLPGSRRRELEAHLPVMIEAVRRIQMKQAARLRMVLPNPELVKAALNCLEPMPDLEIRARGLSESLAEASVAVASSGTVTLECAFFRVPTVVLYKTSWLTYQIARQIIQVGHIAMPNILAGEKVFPEFIQSLATPENIANETLALLRNTVRRDAVQAKLNNVIESLGPPGASQRAAEAVLGLL